MTRRFAILASGTGSNAIALARRTADGAIAGDLAAVIVDRADAPVLARGPDAGLPTVLLDRARFGTRDAFEHELVRMLAELHVDAVVLAGYLRICGPVFLDAWEGRSINLHPSLLPAFPGRDAIGDVLAAGAHETGVTIHFIDAGVDTGPIICQARVAVGQAEPRESLAPRIHELEHRLYPLAVAGLVDGRLMLERGVVAVAASLRAELEAIGATVPPPATSTKDPSTCSVP